MLSLFLEFSCRLCVKEGVALFPFLKEIWCHSLKWEIMSKSRLAAVR